MGACLSRSLCNDDNDPLPLGVLQQIHPGFVEVREPRTWERAAILFASRQWTLEIRGGGMRWFWYPEVAGVRLEGGSVEVCLHSGGVIRFSSPNAEVVAARFLVRGAVALWPRRRRPLPRCE